MNKYIQ